MIASRGGKAAVFIADSRFVTGLGRSHPVENGFAWHPTLGTPYLPGSSVKGLVRAWTAIAKAEGTANPETVRRLLGEAGSAGSVCFLAAVPVSGVKLEVDVITPHYAAWTSDDPPGDWRNPTPIPFLVAARGMRMHFGIVPRGACTESERAAQAEDVSTAFGWLKEALAALGAGAKTAVGYGRFEVDEDATTRLAEEATKAKAQIAKRYAQEHAGSLPPDVRWSLVLEGMSEEDVLQLVLNQLQKNALQDPAERVSLAKAILATPFPAAWTRGRSVRGVQTGRKKLRARAALLHAIVATEHSTTPETS